MSLNLEQWIQKIHQQHPAEIALGLERIKHVAQKLALLQASNSTKTLLIGGTNGKGTTLAIVEALAVACGRRVLSYSSPHILKFNERIRVNGRCVDDASLIQCFEKIELFRGDIKLTFFEYTTLAAMLIEAESEFDIAIYEVGLGGRLDAVNILQPDVSIVTSIGLDHLDWLGDNLEQIATEKIAIARADKALILADDCISEQTTQRAKKLTNKVFKLGVDFKQKTNNNKIEISFKQSILDLDVPLSVHPKNLAGACFAASLLGFDFDLKTTRQALTAALRQLYLPGRFEAIGDSPCVILDVSHNQQAIHYLQHRIKQLQGPVRLVCGMFADKLNDSVLEQLQGHQHQWYLVTLDGQRGATANEISQIIDNEISSKFENIASAIKSALDDAQGCGSIVIFGSFIMVESAMRYFKLDQSR